MTIDLIAGARPNFMKIAPIVEAIHEAQKWGNNIEYRLIHTGQHFDHNMSAQFFTELGIPEPDVNLGAGGGTQAQQCAAIMVGYEQLLMETFKPDVCLVVGDVTSTMACAIVAQKMGVKVAHVEAGIRSGDWTMPEEINRLVTDSITDYFFTTTEYADANLLKAGIPQERVFRVGNTMIDTLLRQMPYFTPPPIWEELALQPKEYLVMTLHRPSNVDQEDTLKNLLSEIMAHSRNAPVLFPVHPRTAKMLERIEYFHPRLLLVAPLGYRSFNYLVQNAKAVITDSGGITEETTVMGVPCLTLRDSTERPETVSIGTNALLGTDPSTIAPALDQVFQGTWKEGSIPPLWDGHTAKRIVRHLMEVMNATTKPSTVSTVHA